jgi:hypothetical protein
MRRREFIVGLGSTAGWSVVARAQQAGMPEIGWLGGVGWIERTLKSSANFCADVMCRME